MVLCAAFTSEQSGSAGSAPVNLPVTRERPSCVWWREGEVSECKECKAMNEWNGQWVPLTPPHARGVRGRSRGRLVVSRQTETRLSCIEPCAVGTVTPTGTHQGERRARLPVGVLRVCVLCAFDFQQGKFSFVMLEKGCHLKRSLTCAAER
jgi:hypothetical protein